MVMRDVSIVSTSPSVASSWPLQVMIFTLYCGTGREARPLANMTLDTSLMYSRYVCETSVWVHSVHSMYTAQYTVYTCTVHSVHTYSAQCTLHSAQCTLHSAQCTLHSTQCTHVQCIVYTRTVHSVHTYSAQCTHVQCIVYTRTVHSVHCTVHSVHYSVLLSPQAKFMPYTDDKVIVTAARDGQIRLLVLSSTGEIVHTKRLAHHNDSAHKVHSDPIQ